MSITAEIIADSVGPNRIRLTTMELRYPRFIHAELMTHRKFGRCASSSRATPIRRLMAAVYADPALPIHWGANQAGMQARAELQGLRAWLAQSLYAAARLPMLAIVWVLSRLGLHKQVANRLLEPWSHITVLVTSTDWDNFWALRVHPDAQPEMFALATIMLYRYRQSVPRELKVGEWHLPYVSAPGGKCRGEEYGMRLRGTAPEQVSAARCARVSYLTHDRQSPEELDDLVLFKKLAGGKPIHASPLEHQARAIGARTKTHYQSGNLRGWVQHRKLVAGEAAPDDAGYPESVHASPGDGTTFYGHDVTPTAPGPLK